MNRSVLSTAAGPLTPVVDAAPAPRRTILLVHGAWHTAAHWNDVTERLTALGHGAFAIDLPGSGLNADYPRSYIGNDPPGRHRGRSGYSATMGPGAAHLHPHAPGPDRPARPAGPDDPGGGRGHARQPVRRAHDGFQPRPVRIAPA